jgi:hypothetical protein
MRLIDDRFTRLQPGVDFGKLDAAPGPEMPTFLAPVPEQWRDIHDPLLVAHWHARLLECLRHPVQVETHPSGHRHVMVLAGAIYDISPNGTVRCFAWQHDDDGLIQLQALPDNEVVAVGAPYAGLWMRGYAQGALQRLSHAHPPHLHDQCTAYAKWLMDQMLAAHWQPDAAVAVREQLAAALQLDSTLRRLAASMCRSHGPQLVRLSEYNHCVLHRSRVERLKREAPQLALLHSLLYQDLSLELDPTRAMARFLEQHGIGRGVWRLLVQRGSEWMRPFLAFYRIPFGEGPAVALDLLSFVQMFSTRELLPRPILHTLMAVGGNPNRLRKSPTYANEYGEMEDLVERVGHLFCDGAPADKIQLLDMSGAIFSWGFDHWAERSERSRRTIRLPGLLREAKAHLRKKELAYRDTEPWATPWTLTSCDVLFEIHILGSALALWHEAQTMRHCTDTYIERCAGGEYLIVSIRPVGGADGQTRGRTTVGFVQTNNGFALHTMSGFANSKVSPRAVAMTNDCLRQLNGQWIQRAHQASKGNVLEREEATNDGVEEHSAVGPQVRAA